MVGHHVYSIPLSLVPREEALVSATVCPRVDAEASDLAVEPFAGEFTHISPRILSEPIDLTVDPVAVVRGSILPSVEAEAVLLSVGVRPLEARAIWPSLDANTFLGVLKPLPLILASISVFGNTLSVAHVVVPLA